MIHLARPFFSEAETHALAEVLASGMLVQGARVAAFEAATADFLVRAGATDVPHCIAVATGTAALELALASHSRADGSIGMRAHDEVIVPAVSWPSPGHAVLLEGAIPVLVDIDFDTWCIDVAAVPALVTAHTVAVIAIDQFGVPARIPALRNVLGAIEVVEDSACALGSSLDGVPCGLLGDVGIYSYHPRKVITTAEGGMCVTRDDTRARHLRTLRNHGQASPGVFHRAGPNQRMSELHAAVGTVQMRKLDEILQRRRALAEEIRHAVDLRWQRAPEGARVNHQTLGFVLPRPPVGSRDTARDALIGALRGVGVEATILSHALHRLPQFAAFAVNGGRRFPVADAVVEGGVAVPLHPGMSQGDVATIIDALRTHAAWAIGREVTL